MRFKGGAGAAPIYPATVLRSASVTESESDHVFSVRREGINPAAEYVKPVYCAPNSSELPAGSHGSGDSIGWKCPKHWD